MFTLIAAQQLEIRLPPYPILNLERKLMKSANKLKLSISGASNNNSTRLCLIYKAIFDVHSIINTENR